MPGRFGSATPAEVRGQSPSDGFGPHQPGTTYATIAAGQPSPSATRSPSASPSAEPGPATPSGQDPLVGWTTAALLVVVLAGFAMARRRAS
jgi:hypothetical protein